MSTLTNVAYAGSCSRSETERGCRTVYLGERCHHDCIPVYRCDCPKPKSLQVQVDEETQFEIEQLIQQKTGLMCCIENGRRCCGGCCR